MKQLHEIQLSILRELVMHESLHYTQMKPEQAMGNNQFDWHIKSLIKDGLIEKIDDQYSLTKEGKRYTNRLDTDTKKIEIQAKLTVWMVCTRITPSGDKEYLLYSRKKHPFYGCQGFPAGKIKLGETIEEAAKRELHEEACLEGQPELLHISHYIVHDEDKSILEDKYMFLCRFSNPSGELKNINEEGEYSWIKESEILDWVTKPFGSIEEVKEVIKVISTYTSPISLREERLQNENF